MKEGYYVMKWMVHTIWSTIWLTNLKNKITYLELFNAVHCTAQTLNPKKWSPFWSTWKARKYLKNFFFNKTLLIYVQIWQTWTTTNFEHIIISLRDVYVRSSLASDTINPKINYTLVSHWHIPKNVNHVSLPSPNQIIIKE